MAAAFGHGDYAYRIVDYRDQRGLATLVPNTQKYFKEKLVEFCNHGVIQKFSVFESKLGAVPAPLMHLKMPKGKKLRHEYAEIVVKDEANQTYFVSLEKGQQGILAQISDKEENVTKQRLDKQWATCLMGKCFTAVKPLPL